MATIEDELIALTDAEGFIKPRSVVDWARANPASEIFKHLEWDDGKAAEAHRLDQARRLIVVHVRSEKGDRATISLIQDRRTGSGYRHLERVLSNRELRRMALRQALRELSSFERRYAHLQELAKVFEAANHLEAELASTEDNAAA